MKLTMQRNKMKVKINNSYSEWFEMKTGVRQGDPISALLFSVVLAEMAFEGGKWGNHPRPRS